MLWKSLLLLFFSIIAALAAVSSNDSAGIVTLSSDVLVIQINKTLGAMTHLEYDGIDILGPVKGRVCMGYFRLLLYTHDECIRLVSVEPELAVLTPLLRRAINQRCLRASQRHLEQQHAMDRVDHVGDLRSVRAILPTMVVPA